MPWEKKGIIYKAPHDGTWRDNSALTPTPIQISSSTIRVYCSFRDSNGIGRIGFVDVDSANPSLIQDISSNPTIDLGESGSFDDNGVILGDLVRIDNSYFMYYIGFQLVKNVKFLAFSGLAISTNENLDFKRYSTVPILDRSQNGRFVQAIHSIIPFKDSLKIFYAVGDNWQSINSKSYPAYNIWTATSDDGIHFFDEKMIIDCNIQNLEYRIGRPRVYYHDHDYIMNFTYGTLDGKYMAGQAHSSDLINWERTDKLFPLNPSQSGWDSLHLCYPAVITTLAGKRFMFYNGNNMGYDGFGYAELSN